MSDNHIKHLKWLEACDAMATIMAKCSKAQYFAFIVDSSGRVRGCGYNGTPSGTIDCVDGGCPRAASGVASSTPYDFGEGLCWAVHAEANALSGIDRSVLEGSTLYVNGDPCLGCAKAIANSGLKSVVCYEEDRQDTELVKDLFSRCGITMTRFRLA
jgi:dCMP deaminase